MVTVGTETNTKTKNQIPKSGNRKEKFKERKNKNMSVFKFNTTRMMIPPEGDDIDGIVDDEEAFARQMEENEKQLQAEIEQARRDYDGLSLSYEELPGELAPNRTNGVTPEEIAQRAQALLTRLKSQKPLKKAA